MTIPSIVWSLLTVIAAVGLAYLFLTRTALGRGFKVPLRQLARKPVTIQYPEIKRDPQPRFHGRHQLNFYEDGLEKCIGCELCAWACPADAIFVQGADNTAAARFSPGERYASDYQINYNRCILCALCIEACPTRALTMTRDYEFSADTREGLIYTKERLLAKPPAGTKPTPHTDEEVRARGTNYYGGLATTPPELTGGDYAPAGPRPMRRASAAVGGLSERAASAPRRAGDTPIGSPGDQRAVPTGADSSHMREAGGDAQAPAFRDDSGRHLGASGEQTRDADGRVIEGDEPRLTDGAGGSLDAREREDERAGDSGGMPGEPQLEREPQRRTEQPDEATQPFPQDVSGGHQPGGVAHTESEARPSREGPEQSGGDRPQHPTEDPPGDGADRGEDERR